MEGWIRAEYVSNIETLEFRSKAKVPCLHTVEYFHTPLSCDPVRPSYSQARVLGI